MRCQAVHPVSGAGCVMEAGHYGVHIPGHVKTPAEIEYEQQRQAFWDKVAAQHAARLAEAVKVVLQPVVLVPTQQQRDAGIRLVDARPDQMPKVVRQLFPAVAATGAACRVTYSHALMPPKRGGEDWWDGHSVVLRFSRADGSAGWGCWVNGRWEGGQWRDGPQSMPRDVGAEEFECRATGRPWAPPVPATCPSCRRAVRVKKDGALYAHDCTPLDSQLARQARKTVGYLA